jgi:hypothetical protein
MAVRTQDMRNPTMRLPRAKSKGFSLRRINIPTIGSLTPIYIVAALGAAVMLYFVLSAAVSWGIERYDDIRYGETRTFHTDAYLGIDDSPMNPSHFVAMNLNRQVVIMHIPGGDTSKTRIINGPYLFGADENRTPVLLDFRDVNGDSLTDMIVNVKNEALIYLNRGDRLGLMTPEERTNVTLE